MAGGKTKSVRGAAVRQPLGTAVYFLLIGAALALVLGVYGRMHPPASTAVTTLFGYDLSFASNQGMLQFKSWLTTIAILFAVAQLLTGLRLYDRVAWPRSIPLWLGDFHRLCGTLALLASLPVAYHCLWSLGFRTSDPRGLAHSFLGCFFYGAFVTKVLAVRKGDNPSWFIPVMGGTVLVALTGIWLSSALLYFTGSVGR